VIVLATKIIMPKAGMAMEEGKIIKWLVREGDAVKRGDVILEIETDKTSMEVEATDAGTVLKIAAQEGERIPVTRTIGYIGRPSEVLAEDEQEPAGKEAQMPKEDKDEQDGRAALQSAEENKIAATPSARRLARERNLMLADIAPSGAHGEIKAADVPYRGKIKATPLARSIAEAEGVDLKRAGTKDGRIYSTNVRELLDGAVNPAKERDEDETIKKPLSGMRRTIAQRMAQSNMEVPPVTMDTKADVTGLLRDRQAKNALGGEKISINDYMLYACAQALAEMPHMNSSFAGDGIVIHKHINIGCAVALEDGLIVPVIRDANRLSLEDVSKSVKELAVKAKNGKLAPDEYTGGTFTVSNLGMYGVTAFTPIINLPESMILGVCSVEKVFGMLADATLGNSDIMGLSLTFDHRVHDGASAAVFLKRIVGLLEVYNGKNGER